MMDRFLRSVGQVKNLFVQVTELGFALVGFIILIYLLLGEASGPYVISVVTNILLLVGAIAPEALVSVPLRVALPVIVTS